MKATKRQVMTAAAKAGVEVDENMFEDGGEVTCEAPAGYRFSGPGTHGTVASYTLVFGDETKADAWGAALEDIKNGIEPCPEGGDEDCYAADCPAWKES